MLKGASSEMLWGPLRSEEFHHQWSGGWEIVHPEQKLVGRAFTAVFMPIRPDVNEVIEADAKAKGLERTTISASLTVCSRGTCSSSTWFGKIEGGTLPATTWRRPSFPRRATVCDHGAVRDLDGIHPLNKPIYVRGFHVSAIRDVMLVGINVPVRIGETTVMSGDVVVGDREGSQLHSAARSPERRGEIEDHRAA